MLSLFTYGLTLGLSDKPTPPREADTNSVLSHSTPQATTDRLPLTPLPLPSSPLPKAVAARQVSTSK